MLILGAMVLCWYGFYNKFPFVFPDSGTYIHTGYLGTVPLDRPLLYGLFLRHISLGESLWLPIIAQGLLVSTLIYLSVKYFVSSTHQVLAYWISIFCIAFLTGASMYVSFIMPDIFSGILIMCAALVLFTDRLTIRDMVFCSVLIILSVGVHSSNLISSLVLFGIISILKLIAKNTFTFSWKKLGTVTLLVISGAVLTSLTHYIYGNTFKLSQGSNVFITARLIDLGLVQEHLAKNCDDHKYNLCEYKDEIKENFLWDENSPLYKTGGWKANNEALKQLNLDILTTPKYFQIFLSQSIKDSFSQFFSFDVIHSNNLGEGSAPYGAINWFYHHQIPQYNASLQSKGKLSNVQFINNAQALIIGISLCGLVFLLFTKNTSTTVKSLIIFTLIAFYTNALICSSLSMVVPRYQGRIIWITPLLLILFASRYFVHLKPLKRLSN